MTSDFYQLKYLDNFDYNVISKKKHLKKFCKKARNILLNDIDITNDVSNVKNVNDILKIFTGADIKTNSKMCIYKYMDGIFNYNVLFVVCNVLFDQYNKVKCIKNILIYYCSSYYDINGKKTLMSFHSFEFLNKIYNYMQRNTKPTIIDFANEYYCDSENIVRTTKLFDVDTNWVEICAGIYDPICMNELLVKENNLLEEIGILNGKLSSHVTINVEEKQCRLQYLKNLLVNFIDPSDDLIKEYYNLKKELEEYDNNYSAKIQQQLSDLSNDVIDVHKKITKLEFFNVEN